MRVTIVNDEVSPDWLDGQYYLLTVGEDYLRKGILIKNLKAAAKAKGLKVFFANNDDETIIFYVAEKERW